MSYNEDLQSNNADLRAILDAVNALPEAGSGGGGSEALETCTVNFVLDSSLGDDAMVYEVIYPIIQDGEVIYLYDGSPEIQTIETVVGKPVFVAISNSAEVLETVIDGGYLCMMAEYSENAGFVCTRAGACTVTFYGKYI